MTPVSTGNRLSPLEIATSVPGVVARREHGGYLFAEYTIWRDSRPMGRLVAFRDRGDLCYRLFRERVDPAWAVIVDGTLDALRGAWPHDGVSVIVMESRTVTEQNDGDRSKS
jgi:hypothetical protein